jgi:hypothetical protein
MENTEVSLCKCRSDIECAVSVAAITTQHIQEWGRHSLFSRSKLHFAMRRSRHTLVFSLYFKCLRFVMPHTAALVRSLL